VAVEGKFISRYSNHLNSHESAKSA